MKQPEGFHRRPVAIHVISVIFLLAPLLVLLALLIFPPEKNVLWMSALTLDLLMFSAGLYFVGLGLWRVRPWGYFFFFGFSSSVIGYSIYLLVFDHSELSVFHIATVVLLCLTAGFLVQNSVAAPYFNPRLRWWERDERHKVDVLAEFKIDGKLIKAPILDISESGVFAGLLMELAVGDTLSMRLRLLDFDFTSDLKVIRKSANQVPGYGLSFVDLARSQNKELRRILLYLSQ